MEADETPSEGDQPINGQPVSGSIDELLAEFKAMPVDYRRIFDALGVGMVLQLADYSIVAWNASATRILGLTDDQISGRTSHDPRWRAIREDGSPFVGDEHPAVVAIKTGASLRNVVMGVEAPGTGLRWISVNSDPVFGPTGNVPIASVTTFADITEERLQEQERKTRYELEDASFASTQLLIGLRGEPFDRALEATLGSVSEVIGADRAYISYLREDAPEFMCTHEWCAAGVPSLHRHRAPVPAAQFARIAEGASAYETIDVPKADASTGRRERDRAFLAERGCEQVLLLPMHSARGLVGFTVFEQITERPWPASIRLELRSLVDGLTSFIETRRLEEIHEATERRYRLLAEHASDLVLSLDETGRILFASPSAQPLLGRSPDELVDTSLLTLVHPEEVAEYATSLAGDIEPDAVTRTTLRLQHADGTWLWFESAARDVVDPETGQYLNTSATLREVTDRVRAIDELRRSESRLRLIAEENPMGLIETALDGECVYVNAAMARMLGRAAEDLVGGRVVDWVSPEANVQVAELAAGATRGEAPEPIEVRSVRPDGSVVWAVVRCVALRDAAGELNGLLSSAEDITERKAAEEALRLSEERFRSLVQNASDIITVLNADGSWRYSSPAGTALLGWPEGYDPPGGIFTLVHPDDVEVAARTFAEVLAGARGPNEPIVFRVQNAHGEYISLETKGQNLIDDPAVNGLLLISRDVSERLRVQEQLAAARDAALAALQAKREFIAVVSHELRTPMHAVLGLSELLASSGLDGEQRLYVESIQRSVHSLSTVVDDILDYTRAESGKLDLHYRNFNLASIVDDVVMLMSPTVAEKGLVLDAQVDDDLPPLLSGDPDRIRQLLTNLVSNAVKYTDTGSIRVHVTASARRDDLLSVRIAVIDTGIGIASESINRLFEPFEQAEGATWRRYGGTGLGLAICRQLVTLMDGTLTVDSTLGEGSEFVATFNVRVVEPPRMTVKVTLPRRALAVPLRPQILVVEDNEVNQLLVDRQLTTLQYEPTVVPDGPTALEFLHKQRWDAVLLDVQLPGMDGLEVARRYRAEEPADRLRVPIIAMTASAMAGDRDACLGAGMDDYLAKPVGIEPLRAMLDRWIQGGAALPTLQPDRPSGSLDALADELGGDRQTVSRMAATFLGELPQRRAAIERASDAAAFASAVHALASASAALSLTGLFNACRAAEQAAKQGQQFDRVTHEHAIDAAVQRSVRALDDWLVGEPVV